MPVKEHLHIYERLGDNTVKNPRFRCIDPDCTHFLYKDVVKGNRAQCECGTSYILTAELLRMRRPRCAKCSVGKRNKEWEEKQRSRNIIKEIMKDTIL